MKAEGSKKAMSENPFKRPERVETAPERPAGGGGQTSVPAEQDAASASPAQADKDGRRKLGVRFG